MLSTDNETQTHHSSSKHIDSSSPAIDYARSVLQRNTDMMRRQVPVPTNLGVQPPTSDQSQLFLQTQHSRENSHKALSVEDHRTTLLPRPASPPTRPQSPALGSAHVGSMPADRGESQFDSSSISRVESQSFIGSRNDQRVLERPLSLPRPPRGLEENLRDALREMEARYKSECAHRAQAERQWAVDVRALEAKIETLSRSSTDARLPSPEAICDMAIEKREQCWAEDFEALRQQLVTIRVVAQNREQEAVELRKRVLELEALASKRLQKEQAAQAALRRVSDNIREATSELLGEMSSNGAAPVGYVAELLQQLQEISGQLGSSSPKRQPFGVSEVTQVSEVEEASGRRTPVSPSSGKSLATIANGSTQPLQVLSSAIPAWSAVVKCLAREHRGLSMQREAYNAVAEQSITTLIATGRSLARASRTLLRRVQRLGCQLAMGKTIRCTKVGSQGKPECLIWGGDWAPLNGDLPSVHHAVAAWLLTASEAKSVLQRLRSGVNAEEVQPVVPLEETTIKDIGSTEIVALCSSDNESHGVDA